LGVVDRISMILSRQQEESTQTERVQGLEISPSPKIGPGNQKARKMRNREKKKSCEGQRGRKTEKVAITSRLGTL